MKRERSAGIVVYRRDPKTGKLFYLLLHYLGGHWDLPKGKIEEEEKEADAAMREVKEETGLDVQPVPNFSEQITYYFRGKEHALVHKVVIFFVGEESSGKEVMLSDEHLAYEWLAIGPALNKLTYNNARNLLSRVNQFLLARYEAQENAYVVGH